MDGMDFVDGMWEMDEMDKRKREDKPGWRGR